MASRDPLRVSSSFQSVMVRESWISGLGHSPPPARKTSQSASTFQIRRKSPKLLHSCEEHDRTQRASCGPSISPVCLPLLMIRLTSFVFCFLFSFIQVDIFSLHLHPPHPRVLCLKPATERLVRFGEQMLTQIVIWIIKGKGNFSGCTDTRSVCTLYKQPGPHLSVFLPAVRHLRQFHHSPPVLFFLFFQRDQ